MTIQSAAVLIGLKKLTKNTGANISYLYNSTCFCLVSDTSKTYNYARVKNEIESIVTALVSDGYLIYTDPDDQAIFCLTQKSMHFCQNTLYHWLGYVTPIASILAAIFSILTYFK